MSRRPRQDYRCAELAELCRQLLFAPSDRRAEQVLRAEALHDQIDEDAAYPLDFLAYRITRYRRESGRGEDAGLLVGAAVKPDLRLMIDTLSRSAKIPLQGPEPVETAEQLAQRLQVSTKTLSRWRALGLRWRWVVPPHGGRRVLVYPRKASDRFVAEHPELVSRASRFTQIEPAEKVRLIERARRIAQAREVTLNQVAAHLAIRTGRALQTMRQLLEQHDQRHPHDRLFAHRQGPLTARQRRLIARAYRMGVPVTRMTRHFNRTRTTIHRVIHERRAAALRRLRLRYIATAAFERDDAEQVIFRTQAESSSASRPRPAAAVVVDDLPVELRPLYRRPVLDAAIQRTLFVQFNYCKFKAAKLIEGLDRYTPRAGDLDAIEALLTQARRIRDRLVMTNLPVVLSVARRHLLGKADRSQGPLVELLEIGNQALIEAIDLYDFTRGQTFESFLTFMLMRRFVSEGQAPRRAHRRLSGVEALQRLHDLAGESGVALELEPE